MVSVYFENEYYEIGFCSNLYIFQAMREGWEKGETFPLYDGYEKAIKEVSEGAQIIYPLMRKKN